MNTKNIQSRECREEWGKNNKKKSFSFVHILFTTEFLNFLSIFFYFFFACDCKPAVRCSECWWWIYFFWCHFVKSENQRRSNINSIAHSMNERKFFFTIETRRRWNIKSKINYKQNAQENNNRTKLRSLSYFDMKRTKLLLSSKTKVLPCQA